MDRRGLNTTRRGVTGRDIENSGAIYQTSTRYVLSSQSRPPYTLATAVIMCGIIAAFEVRSPSEPRCPANFEAALRQSLDYLRHQGPDGSNLWVSNDSTVGLGHTRLAIMDLSPAAAQPFHDFGRDLHVVVSGEIYNHRELRNSLRSRYSFTSESDSEIIIPLYNEYGISFLERLDGEFALCLYDGRQKQFFAARDRHGNKPLFWSITAGRLLVTTDMPALLPFTHNLQWDVRSLATDGWLRGNTTAFLGIQKLGAGDYMTCTDSHDPIINPWWRPEFLDKTIPDDRSESEMIIEIRQRLADTLKQRLQGQCRIAVSLSGGLDSSFIVGLLSNICDVPPQALLDVPNIHVSEPGALLDPSPKDITCFTLSFPGFYDTNIDESEIAQRTASAVGARHVRVEVTEEDLVEAFRDATVAIGGVQPDFDYLCQAILAKRVRQAGFTALLTGTGADDYFAGYSAFIPDSLRERDLGWSRAEHYEVRELCSAGAADSMAVGLQAGFDDTGHNVSPDVDARARRMFGGTSIEPFLWPVAPKNMPWAQWVKDRYKNVSIHLERAQSIGLEPLSRFHQLHPLSIAQYTWIRQVLPGTDLSFLSHSPHMLESIETRTPCLSNRLTDYARSLPVRAKINVDPQTFDAGAPQVRIKYIWHQAAKPFITQEVDRRRKKAFTGPIKISPGGPMEKMLTSLITPKSVEKLGFVDWPGTQGILAQAFSSVPDISALRTVIMVAQLIVIQEQMNVVTVHI